MCKKKIDIDQIDRNDHIRFQKMNSPTTQKSEFSKNETSCTFRTGGKPSTWFPPERLVEQNDEKNQQVTKENQNEKKDRLHNRRKHTAHDRARVVWRAPCLHRGPVIRALSDSSSVEIEQT